MHTVSKNEISVMETNKQVPVIEFNNVSVKYRVPHERLSGIKEYTIRWLQRRVSYEEFYALHRVSFEVIKGEVFGVVGRNGAGKSTMLKVMARVLHPSGGRVIMRGNVAPLLELGGGFHQELTGRENIFLNMSLLGHSHKKTEDLFDSIVEFSGYSPFLPGTANLNRPLGKPKTTRKNISRNKSITRVNQNRRNKYINILFRELVIISLFKQYF